MRFSTQNLVFTHTQRRLKDPDQCVVRCIKVARLAASMIPQE